MKESQNIEFKQSWRDEYLKWICGFANAQGGELYIGLNDKGSVVGLADARRLLEDIPNKIQAILGIICDIDLKKDNGLDYLKITVEPHSFPVSYKGQYHYRSGSTKQELKGSALDQFIMRKQGKHWDSVPVPRMGIKDLDLRCIEEFRQIAVNQQRLDETSLGETIPDFLERLKLLDEKNNYLTRAAVLLFSRHPEYRVGGAFVKIAYFQNEADIIFQDVIEGDLFSQADRVLDLIMTKYTRALISYKGSIRHDTPPVPKAALREAIHNAIVHKDYGSSIPIQIRVYGNKIRMWNASVLPEGWTLEKLIGNHSSKPYNPDIAAAFFRTGRTESWGRGIENIFTACRNAGVPDPVYELEINGLWTEFYFSKNYREQAAGLGQPDSDTKTGRETDIGFGMISEKIRNDFGKDVANTLILIKKNPEYTAAQISKLTGKSSRTIENYLKKLKDAGVINRKGAKLGGHWEILNNIMDP